MKKTFAILLVTILALLAAGALAAGDDSPRMILVTCYRQVGWGDSIFVGCVDEEGNVWTLQGSGAELAFPGSPEEQLAYLAQSKDLVNTGVRFAGDDLFDMKGLIACTEDQGSETEDAADDAGVEESYAVTWDDDRPQVVLLGVSGDERFENTDPNAQALYLLLRKIFPEVPCYAYSNLNMGPKGFRPVPVIEFLKMQESDLADAVVTCYVMDCEAGMIESEVSEEDQEWILDLVKNGKVTGKANATMVTGGTWVYIINDAEGNDIGSVELYRGMLVGNDGMYTVSK